jgi:hypothetical protein
VVQWDFPRSRAFKMQSTNHGGLETADKSEA